MSGRAVDRLALASAARPDLAQRAAVCRALSEAGKAIRHTSFALDELEPFVESDERTMIDLEEIQRRLETVVAALDRQAKS